MKRLLKWVGIGLVMVGLVGCLVPEGRGKPPYVPDDSEVIHIPTGTRCIYPDGHEMVVAWDGTLVAAWRFQILIEEYRMLRKAYDRQVAKE